MLLIIIIFALMIYFTSLVIAPIIFLSKKLLYIFLGIGVISLLFSPYVLVILMSALVIAKITKIDGIKFNTKLQ